MRKLLFVANVGWFFMSHRLPLAIAARAHGYEVHIAAGVDPVLDQGTEAELVARGFVFHRLNLSRSGAGPMELLRDYREIARLYRSIRPDIVHLVAIKPVVIGGLAARLNRIKTVVMALPGRGAVFTATGFIARVKQALAIRVYRAIYRPHQTCVIVQNVEDREFFLSRNVFVESDVCLIRGSGVDTAAFSVTPEEDTIPVVVLASRMLRQKGVADFAAAAVLLAQRKVPVRLVLVGEPDLGNADSHTTEELQALSRESGIEWWGRRGDMPEVFRQCHIVCLPTFYCEGVPKVLIEAAACGRPIVTTDTPGCRDIVRHEINGLLVPVRAPGSLADAIEQLVRDQELRRAMGVRGRELVEQEFDVRLVADATMSIYRRIGGLLPQ